MKHLLVPTDFSDYAYNACLFALHLAAKYNAKITLFHTFHVPIIDPLMPSEYLSDLAESAQRENNNRMEELKQKLNDESIARKLGNVEMAHYVTLGFAVDEISSVSEKLQPDLIVMGRRYTEGMAKILLGSITASVLESSRFPVLIVPENVSMNNHLDNVLYAAEYGDSDDKTIIRLFEFSKPLHAKVHCVHISEKANVEAEQRLAEMEVTFAKEIEKGNIVFHNDTSEDVAEGLADYIEKNEIHLMAMLTHKRSFFVKLFDRSFTKKVAFNTNIPLLVFHE